MRLWWYEEKITSSQMSVSPDVWGPNLWRLLHTLADVSDRRDIFPLWNTFIKATCRMLPCDRCRKHMDTYWNTTNFMPRSWISMSGSQVRETIRQKLWMFHNAVNERLGKSLHPPLSTLRPIPDTTLVGNEPSPEITEFRTIRDHYLREVHELAESLPGVPNSGTFIEWRRSLHLLLHLLRSGSMG